MLNPYKGSVKPLNSVGKSGFKNGFTGTPIKKQDMNTAAVFGQYVDIYDITQAVEDGATVNIFYESRLAKIALGEEGRKLIESLDQELGEADLSEVQKAKAKWTHLDLSSSTQASRVSYSNGGKCHLLLMSSQ
jgi:type I site-specific restriction-modification system R (restriction) subunit